MQKNFRKTYITWYLILVLSSILIQLGIVSGNITLSQDLAVFLTIIGKIGIIVLTIWYGLKVGLKNVSAWVLGLATLLPFMIWISAAILLTRKTGTQTISLRTSDGRPVLSREETFDENKIAAFIEWFIKNEPFANTISNRSSNIIFNEGNTPNVPIGYNPSIDRKFDNLSEWFVAKLIQDIKLLRNASQSEFKSFLDNLYKAGDKTLMTSGMIAINHNLNFDRFIYDYEIQKIPAGIERELFKKNFLDDNVIGAEIRILGWLYHEWFGDWYKIQER